MSQPPEPIREQIESLARRLAEWWCEAHEGASRDDVEAHFARTIGQAIWRLERDAKQVERKLLSEERDNRVHRFLSNKVEPVAITEIVSALGLTLPGAHMRLNRLEEVGRVIRDEKGNWATTDAAGEEG